jgi:selenocysteine lyase/cysteine desulfurase
MVPEFDGGPDMVASLTRTEHGEHSGQRGLSDRRVHLDAAGVGRMPAAVRAVVDACLRKEDAYGPHELEEYLDQVRGDVHGGLGDLLNVPADDTMTATGADTAFDALVSRLPLGPGDRIWTTPFEDVARLTTLYALRDRTRCRLDVVPLNAHGDLDLDWMAEHIGDEVALVSVAHVPSALGAVSPVEAVGRLLAPYRCVYAVDASHSVGRLPVDVARIGCHVLTGDGWRFLGGPRSVGFAYAAPRLRALFTDDGPALVPQPHGAAVAGLNAALLHHSCRPSAACAPPDDLLAQLRDAVEAVPGTELIAPGREQSTTLAFRHADLSAAHIRRALAARGVIVWKTVAQQLPLFLPGRGITTAVRASLHHDTSSQDVAVFAGELDRVVQAGRSRDAYAAPAPQPARRHGHLTLCPAV